MLIFTSSIGRSGTKFIASLFKACTDIPTFHALEPNCVGEHNITELTKGNRTEDLEKKLALIRAELSEDGSYFESSQMFNRILSEYVLEEFSDIHVIQLLRDPMEVARSYTNRDSYPSNEDKPWRVPLNTSSAQFKFPENLTPFQENLCDWLDNELMLSSLESALSKTVVFQFSDFRNEKAILDLFINLGLEFSESKLSRHLQSEEEQDRNQNKIPTRISKIDFNEANELLKILRKLNFPSDIFKSDCYLPFPFVNALLKPNGIVRPTVRQQISLLFSRSRSLRKEI